ncbi:MAG: hypothetical protein D6820_10520 [Lentisphaerae bacterium]|nr:MAG: hypothetical protein D6820_10520 [Lentisphaerota bacterium]
MGETSATVVGTVFEVSYEKAEVRLEVREGKVRLRRGNNSLLVPAGYFATAGPRQPLRLHAIDRQDAPAIAGDGNQAYFSLVSAASARPVAHGERLPENTRIPLAQLPHGPLNILYHPPAALAGKIEYVNFRVAGPEELVTTEENAPYAVFGNPPAAAKHKTSLVLNPWRPQRGRYTIQVTPWIRDKGRIIRGPSRRIQLIFE